MSLADAVSVVTHLAFAGLWTGGVVFVTFGVLPLAARGDLNAGPLGWVAGRLKTLSRASALLLFVTGGHLAGTRYTAETLTGTTRGYLVLAMLGLWLVLAALVEVGAGRLTDGAGRDKVREPARRAQGPLRAASLVAVLLLIDAGLLAGGITALDPA